MTTKKSNTINNKVGFFNPKFIPRSTKTLILSDKTYKKVQAKDPNPCTAINSYPLAKVQDLAHIVKQYSGSHKIENLNIHVGHNQLDLGNSDFETARILMESASKTIKKLSPLNVAHVKILPVRDDFLVVAKKTM